MHRIWHENVILEEGNDYVIGVNDHTPVTDSKNKIKETVGVSLFYFSKSDWFNVIVVFENESYYYYCNIASPARWQRSEEHTSELQSRFDLVCRLLLEKKKKTKAISC